MLVVFEGNGQSIATDISNSVGLISFDDKSRPGAEIFGTGTLIVRRLQNNRARVFLVTNKHVLPNRSQNDSVRFRIRNPKEGAIPYFDLRIPVFISSGAYHKDVKNDPDGNDLTLINISDILSKNAELVLLVNYMFNESYLLSKDSVEKCKIYIGDEIQFIGFPSLLYDKRNISPLLRTGVIASTPKDDYYFSDEFRKHNLLKFRELLPDRLNGFLIDANVFGGSSGSIVFTKPKFIRVGKDHKMLVYGSEYGEVFVLGVLTTGYFDIGSPSGQRMQLGGVISASQIIKTMNLFK